MTPTPEAMLEALCIVFQDEPTLDMFPEAVLEWWDKRKRKRRIRIENAIRNTLAYLGGGTAQEVFDEWVQQNPEVSFVRGTSVQSWYYELVEKLVANRHKDLV